MSMAAPRFFSREDSSPTADSPRETRLRCGLCPHRCLISEGRMGLCGVRANRNGAGDLPFYGRITAANLDPMEKKPLYHFRPGSSVFSVGFTGCSLRCPFCQNWEIARRTDAPTRLLEPSELVSLARKSGAGAIAYTYSEPLVHLEFIMETMELARRSGIANVLVTNGFANAEAAGAALEFCDAANIDLKSGRKDTYERELGGGLDAVKDFIALAFSRGVHTEVTTLVVTDLNDDEEEIRSCAEFLCSLSPDIPYHLSAYHPDYEYRAPSTDPAVLARCAAIARASLRYVYVGNLIGESNSTRCPRCGAVVVKREKYRVDAAGLVRDGAGTARCRACAETLPFRV